MTRQRGYSLIELVVLLVITAILAAFAVPYFAPTETEAAWFHDQVKAAVRYAQRQAVAQRRCVFVSMSATQVQLFYDNNGNCVITATPVADFASGNAYSLTAPGTTSISASPATFSFNGLGQPSAAVSVSVGGRMFAVLAETGYVQ